MTIRKHFRLLATLLLSWPLLALGALDRIEEAYELTLAEVTLPAHSASRVVIRSCDTCDPVMLPVNGNTRYLVQDDSVELPELLDAASAANRDNLVMIFYATDTRVVTRIVLP